MPSSLLWAVDVYGRVYSLSTAGQQWDHCRDAHLEFKRVTAVQQCCWSIACDHNIYMYLHASDVPIRNQEETYENQVCSIVIYVISKNLLNHHYRVWPTSRKNIYRKLYPSKLREQWMGEYHKYVFAFPFVQITKEKLLYSASTMFKTASSQSCEKGPWFLSFS